MGAWLERTFGNGKQIPPHGSILSFQLLAVISEYALHRPEQSLTHCLEVAIRSQSQGDLVPDEVGAGNLPEDARRRLEYDGVREGHPSSRWRTRRLATRLLH